MKFTRKFLLVSLNNKKETGFLSVFPDANYLFHNHSMREEDADTKCSNLLLKNTLDKNNFHKRRDK